MQLYEHICVFSWFSLPYRCAMSAHAYSIIPYSYAFRSSRTGNLDRMIRLKSYTRGPHSGMTRRTYSPTYRSASILMLF